MSSNFLNYELSKQLKELGVEFTCTSIASVIAPGLIAPATAQLIDEIMKRFLNRRFLGAEALVLVFHMDGKFCFEDNDDELSSDPCCTTALGKALIELVKGEKDGTR